MQDHVGVADLADLFNDCLDCFQQVQINQSTETRKYTDQQLRFAAWGNACGFSGVDQGSEPLSTQAHAIPRIREKFHSLKKLFADPSILKGRYGLKVANSQSSNRQSFRGFVARMGRTQRQGDTVTTTQWVISDKEKFDRLVDDLKDILDELENATRDLGGSRQQRVLLESEAEGNSGMSSLLEGMEAARLDENDVVTDPAGGGLSTLLPSHTSELGGTSYDTAQTLVDRQDRDPVINEPPPPSSASTMPQNMRLVSGLTRPPTETFDGSKTSTSLDDVTILKNYNQVLNIQNMDLPLPPRVILQHLRFSGYPFNSTSDSSTLTFAPINRKLDDLLATFIGPSHTPYEGGTFYVRMQLSNFPFSPPKCTFLTKIYHPNINPSGKICLDVLGKARWSPILGLSRTIMSLISILSDPGLEDPLVPEIAALYMTDRDQYMENAKIYTRKYAPPNIAPVFSPDGSWELCEQPEPSPPQRRLARLLCEAFGSSYTLCPFSKPWFVFRDSKIHPELTGENNLQGILVALDLVLYEICDFEKPWDFDKVANHVRNVLNTVNALTEAGFAPDKPVDGEMQIQIENCRQKLEMQTALLQSSIQRVKRN